MRMRAALTLGLSLALTGALLVMNVVVFRARSGGVVAGPESRAVVPVKRVIRVLTSVAPPPRTTNAPPFHWSALESPDYGTFAANLRAIGCPEHTLRDILLPDIEQAYDERKAALETEAEDTFWETADVRDARGRVRAAKTRALELEKRALIQQLLGAELSFEALKELRSDGTGGFVELLLGFTDLAKSDQMFTIHTLRGEDIKAYTEATDDILLDEDFPALHALRDRFEGELARALAPSEMEELRLRLASLNGFSEMFRGKGGMSITAAEMREISRLRADTLDMFAEVLDLGDTLYPEELRERGAAAFEESLRRYLGAERYADMERGKDQLFRELAQSTDQQGVAKAALLQAYDARRIAETQAQEIRADAQLSGEERELLLAALRAQTTQTLTRSLGPVGVEAYLKQHGKNFTNSLSMPVRRPANGTVITQ